MRISLVLLAFLALTTVACSTSTSSSSTNLCANSGAAITVDVTEYAFTPSSVTVIDGQSVCWANTGSMTHTVVEDVAGRFGGNLPPSLVGKICEALACLEFWHEGRLVEPANAIFIRANGGWHKLFFDSGVVFW